MAYCVGSGYALPINLTQKNITVEYSGYYTQTADPVFNWGIFNAGERHFISLNHQSRIRQSGNLTQIQVWIQKPATMDKMFFDVWRQNTSTTYDRIYTENIIYKVVGGDNIVNLNVAVPVIEGDYIGYGINNTETTPSTYQLNMSIGSGIEGYYVTGSISDNISYKWGDFTSTDRYVKIKTYGFGSPVFAIAGDSIAAGHPAHYSFIETTNTTNIPNQILYQLSHFQDNASYQNMGIGSQTTTMIAARFDRDVGNLSPNVAVIQGGVNDVIGGAANPVIEGNIATMANTSLANDITPIVILPLPWTSGTTNQMLQMDNLTGNMSTSICTWSGVYCVNASPYVGIPRVGGSPGNLWDINASYTADASVHYNEAGYTQIALAISDKIDEVNTLIASFTPSGPISTHYPNGTAFVDTSTGSPTAWMWNATNVTGDNIPFTFNTTQNATFFPSNAGNYTISLNASNSYTYNLSTQSTWVNVTANPLTSSFTPNNTVGYYTPMPVTFTDTSTGYPPVTTWNYTFGDTYTSTLQNPQHIYTVANNYTVTQNVTNATGSFSTSTKYVELATDDSIWLKSWMQFNNATVTDLKGNAWTATSGAVTSIDYSKSGFGNSVLYVPTGDARIESASSSIWDRAGQSANMEFWINVTTIGDAGKPIIKRSSGSSGTTNGWGFYNSNATQYGYSFWYGNAATNHTDGIYIPTNTWTHVDLSRNTSGYWTVYKNGIYQTSKYVGNGGFDTTNPVMIGAWGAGTEHAFRMDEFRYTQGQPIFVSDYSVPYAQYNGNLYQNYVNINANATLRYKTNPTDPLQYVYNQTGPRNRTVQIQNITNATSIYASANYEPLYAVVSGIPVLNKTVYSDMTLDSYSIDSVNGVISFKVSRAAGIKALFDNRTDLVDIPMLYYNYTTDTTSNTYFTNANITDGQHNVTYPIYNFISTPIGLGMWGTPIINFTANNVNPAYGETVTFAGSVTNYPNAFNWSFGDGTYSSLQNPTHAYYSNGVKTVSFRAYHSANESITNTTTKVDYITVGASPLPVPTFTSALTYASPPATIQFNVTNGGLYTTAWNWSFGDETWSNVTTDLTKNVTHTYSYPGNYDVTLYETNNAGTGYKTSLDFVVITDPKFVLTPSPLPLNRGTVNTSHFAINNISHAAGIATNISYNKSAVTIQSISLNSIGGTGLTLSSSYDNSAGTAKFGVTGSDLTYTTETNIIDIAWKANVNITNATAPVRFSATNSQSFVTSTSGYPANRFVNAVSKTGGNIELRNDTVQKTLTFKNAYTKNLVSGIQVRLDWTGVYNGTDTTTTGSYTFLSSTFGSITVVIAADGYYNVTQTIAIDNADETVLMSPTSGAPSQVTWYTPQQIKLTAVDLFGKPLEGVEISATPLDFTAPDDWAQILIGVQPAVNMSGTTLLGTTGIDGSWVAPMLPSYQYQIILTNAAMGVSHTVTLYPSDPSYVIYCPTTGQGTQKGVEKMQNLMNSTLYVTEPNSSYITWNLMYLDPSGYTTALQWEVECWNNHTIMYSNSWGSVGISDVINDSYTFPSVPKGMEYRAQYNATRDVP